MDYPVSDPTVGLVGGKFSDGDPTGAVAPSRDPAAWANAVTDEILNAISDGGLTPDEEDNTQLAQVLAAIRTFGAGTVSLPTVFLAGDTNTGLYHPAADTMAMTNNGVESMRWDAAGNVGIGKTSALTAKLHVMGGLRPLVIEPTSGATDGVKVELGYDGLRFTPAASYQTVDITNLSTSGKIRTFVNGMQNTAYNADGSQEWGTFSLTGATEGKMIVGTSSRVLRSSENTAATSKTHIEFYNPNGLVGSISTNGTATAYATSSDYRLKENLQPLDGVQVVKDTPVWAFNFKAAPEHTTAGWMAHELQALVPKAVTGDKDATRIVAAAVIAANGLVIAEGITESDWQRGVAGISTALNVVTAADGTTVLAMNVSEGEFQLSFDADLPPYPEDALWHATFDITGDPIYPADSTWQAEYAENIYQAVDQSKTTPYLWAATQQLIAKAEKYDALADLLVIKGVITQAELDAL